VVNAADFGVGAADMIVVNAAGFGVGAADMIVVNAADFDVVNAADSLGWAPPT